MDIPPPPAPHGPDNPQPPQGPYGPYPPAGPYPPPPYGYYPPPPLLPPYNGLAIASFVVAMSCVPVLGLIFGIVALRQIRRRGHRGRGFAIAGIVLNGLWTLVLAVVVTLGALGYLDEGSTDVQRLREGDCVSAPEGFEDRNPVDVVACSQSHDGEVYAVVTGAPYLADDGKYPGEDLLGRYADERCSALLDDYTGEGAKLPESVAIHSYTPSRRDWAYFDRNVICLLGDEDGGLTGSLKSGADSGTSSDDAEV